MNYFLNILKMLRKIYIFIYIYLILISFNFIESSLKFNIPAYRDKCFQEDIYIEGTILIRYDLTGFEKYFQGNEQTELFKNIKIFIKNSNDKKIYETELKSRKDKFVIYLEEAGTYQICTRYFKPYRGKELPGSVLMGLKIRSDYHYKELEQSLHKNDIKDFWKRIRNIKQDMYPTIQAEKNEIEEEDKTAKSMISSINTYYRLCLVQLIIIILITGFTLFSYRSFFKNKLYKS